MRIRYAYRWLTGASALLAALALGACNEATPGGPESGLTLVEANELAEVIAEDAEAFAAASTYDSRHGIRLDIFDVRPVGGHAGMRGRLPCDPVISPDSPDNLDGDHVPDAVLLDFSGITCTMGDLTVAMDGTLGIEDPAIPGFGIRFVFTGLSKTVSRGEQSRSVTWNGVRQVVGSPSNPGSQLTHTITNFTTDLVFPNGHSASHAKNWNARFVADVDGSIQYGSRLPSGIWTFDGNSTWVRNAAATFEVEVETTTPLHFNADCTVAPRFDAGVIVVQVTRNGHATTVTIEHTACGQKIVTRS